MRKAVLAAALLAIAACSRQSPPPPKPLPAAKSQPPASPTLHEFSYQISGDARSPSGLACWSCYLRAQDELKTVKGVTDVKVHPDAGLLEVRTRGSEDGLVAAIRKALPGSESLPLSATPPIPRRVRMTKEIPLVLKQAFAEATDERPLIVAKCVAAACSTCEGPEPDWGDSVMRVEIDLDARPEAKVWLTPEAVPEWICFDRHGRELHRWRGRVDGAGFVSRLRELVSRARRNS
jgi:copper chaperone CopZ